jgi:hypothetical protein
VTDKPNKHALVGHLRGVFFKVPFEELTDYSLPWCVHRTIQGPPTCDCARCHPAARLVLISRHFSPALPQDTNQREICSFFCILAIILTRMLPVCMPIIKNIYA